MNIVGTMCKFYTQRDDVKKFNNGQYCEIISKVSDKTAKEWGISPQTYAVRFNTGLIIEAEASELEPTGQKAVKARNTLVGQTFLYKPEMNLKNHPYKDYSGKRCRVIEREDDTTVTSTEIGVTHFAVMDNGDRILVLADELVPVD